MVQLLKFYADHASDEEDDAASLVDDEEAAELDTGLQDFRLSDPGLRNTTEVEPKAS